VHKIIFLHQARIAGIVSIKTVEKSGAVPHGIYNPTFSIALNCL